MSSDLLRIARLTVDYGVGGRRITALDNLSLEIPRSGYTLGVVGESGSGKTTLGMSILRLIDPPGKIVDGQIEYCGSDILSLNKKKLMDYRWQEVSMVYQSAMNSLNPVKPISDPIIEVLRQHTRVSKSEASRRASQLLSEVGIKSERHNDYPHELSGGMRQRVAIALSIALSPKLLIADEPTSALDVVVQKQILQLLKKEVSEKQLSLIFITHEISILCGIVGNVAVMYKGEIVEIGPIDRVLFRATHPYTEMLLGSLLTIDASRDSLANVISRTDTANSPLRIVGCKYADHCKYVFKKCLDERPALRKVENDRWVACHKF